MDSALIVSAFEKSIVYVSEVLNAASIHDISTVDTCGEARRLLMERSFDLVVINAPLRDESGEILSRNIASQRISQVILIVKSEFYEEISALTEEYGVLTVSKPMNRALLWAAVKFAKSAGAQLKSAREENDKLKQKIEDIRIIDRAKCILISHLNMSEQRAHRYIEKQAMDMRSTKRTVAEGILKTYEN